MQRPSKSDQVSSSRERCGRSAAFAPSPVPEKAGFGICQHTAGDAKHPGMVRADQARCIYLLSKFKIKEFA